MKLLADMLLDGLVALANFTLAALPWAVGIYCLWSLVSLVTGVALPVKLVTEWKP